MEGRGGKARVRGVGKRCNGTMRGRKGSQLSGQEKKQSQVLNNSKEDRKQKLHLATRPSEDESGTKKEKKEADRD